MCARAGINISEQSQEARTLPPARLIIDSLFDLGRLRVVLSLNCRVELAIEAGKLWRLPSWFAACASLPQPDATLLLLLPVNFDVRQLLSTRWLQCNGRLEAAISAVNEVRS